MACHAKLNTRTSRIVYVYDRGARICSRDERFAHMPLVKGPPFAIIEIHNVKRVLSR
jgi:hypothetical protein